MLDKKTLSIRLYEFEWIILDFIFNYWKELLTFGAIFIVLLIDCAPDMTWINTCSDGVHYTYSAQYLLPSHKSSAPLYLLVAHFWLMIPIGSEFWRLAFLNVIIGTVGAWLIYLIIKDFTNNKYYALIGALVYGSSALAISQNTIVETYPAITTAGLACYYFALRKNWIWSAIMIGIAGAVHPLAMMFIVPLLVKFRELRRWRMLGIMALFTLFYLYVPLTNREPYMWHQPNGSGFGGFIRDTFQTAQMLSAGLSIWDLPKRIIDTVLQLLLNWNIGIIALVILFWRSKWYKEILFWFIVLPVLYYVTNLAPQTYVYMQPAIAFGCVGIGVGLNKVNNVLSNRLVQKSLVYGITIVSIGLLIFNCNYFDIGRTLDPELSANKFWKEELPKLKNGDILVAQQGWEWAMVYKYNADYGKNIKVVCVGTLPSEVYQNDLKKNGIKVIDMPEVDLGNRPNAMAKWIVNNNDNVWMSRVQDSSTYGADIVPVHLVEIIYPPGFDQYKHWANPDEIQRIDWFDYETIDLLNESYSPESIVDGSRDLDWRWKPSNPYDVTTGAIEVEEWRWIVFSNYNCMMFGMLVVISFIPVWIVWQLVVRKKKWKVGNLKKEIKGMV